MFGYFSDIIGKAFFPPDQKGHAALIESFVVFGGAFIVRPIGGALIGRMGDTHGRKSALETSILLMAFPTFALGCLPTFETVGWLAPTLLVILRLIQGLSVGGQLMSSVVFTLERSGNESNWGFWGASVFAAATVGTVIGSMLSYALRAVLDEEELLDYGWRIPFLFGALGVIPGAYLKYRAKEHPIVAPEQEEEAGSGKGGGTTPNLVRQDTLAETFGPANRRALIASALVPCLPAATYYITFVWLAVFMESIADPPVPHAFAITSMVGFLAIFANFLGGIIADRLGKRTLVLYVVSLLIGITGPIFLWWIATTSSPGVAFLCQFTLGSFLAIWNGAMIPFIVKRFPPHLRLTSVNIGYNLAVGICGGFSPAVATLLVDRFSKSSPGFMLTALAMVSWGGIWLGHGIDGAATADDGFPSAVATTEMSRVV